MPFSRLRDRGERGLKRLAVGLARTVVRSHSDTTIDTGQVKSILIVRQHNQLGDMLCVVPLLRALRARFPGSRLVLLTSPVNHAVMLHHRLLDAVLNYDKREFLAGGRIKTKSLRAFVRLLRGYKFDLAIVPATVSMSITSDLLAYLSGARWRIGPGKLEAKENPGAFLYTHPAELSWQATPERHQTLRNMDVCLSLSLNTPELGLELTLLPEEAEAGRKEIEPLRAGARHVVAFHPGAGKVPNRWPVNSFYHVIRDLHAGSGCAIIVIKGPMDDDPVSELVSKLGVPCYLVEKRTIREVASILGSVDLLVSNDTGVMHVGAAAGTPVLSLFGPTNPREWAPPGAKNRYIRCESGVIGDITVEAVLTAAREMLREHRA
jgi:heptosyltransferase III